MSFRLPDANRLVFMFSRTMRRVASTIALTAVLFAASPANAGFVVSGGSATITIKEGMAASISEFDAYFNAATTRAQTLSLPAPGNVSFTESSNNPGTVTLSDFIRPYGEVPLNDAGGTTPGVPGASRTREATTLQIENPNNVLGSWSTSNDAFAFVGNSILGEQIAFTNMQRWTGPFSGSLVYGDFALRYTGSDLVLTSNIDFLNAAWAYIGSPTISLSGHTLTISGDLLIGGALFVLDSSAIPRKDFGDITITATLVDPAAVPEPGTGMLAVLGLGTVGALRRWRQTKLSV